MESGDEMIEKVKKVQTEYYAFELFTEMDRQTFKKTVMPFIRAYYKHEYGDFLFIHTHKDNYDIIIQIEVNKYRAELTFNNNSDFSNIQTCMFKYEKIKPKDIFNYLYYEYKLLFHIEEGEFDEIKPKQKLML